MWNGWYTILAAGYYMYHWNGYRDLYPIATLVLSIKAGNSMSDSYKSAFGFRINLEEANWTNPADFYYWFYHYYWG